VEICTQPRPLVDVLASVLHRSPEEIEERAAHDSFVGLGGSSVDAMNVVAGAEEELGIAIDLGQLLGLAPLAAVLSAARAAAPRSPEPQSTVDEYRPVILEQEGFLKFENFIGRNAVHQISSGELIGPFDEARLLDALRWLVARHEALRTVFVARDDGFARRVLPSWQPRLIRQELRAPAGEDPVTLVHAALAKGTGHLICSVGRPPVAYVLTRLADDHHLLSVVIHHALADGWSVGLLWRELVEQYRALRAGSPVDDEPAPSPDILTARWEKLTADDGLVDLTQRRIAQLASFPTVVELPSDATRPARFDFQGERLRFGLGPAARDAADRLADLARITRTSVLLAAWQLVIGRRCGLDRFLMGVTFAGRTDALTMRLVAPCASLVPIGCELTGDQPVDRYLQATSRAVAEGVTFASVPFASLSRGLRALSDGRRVPLVQVVFSAQDDFVPERLDCDGLVVRMHESFQGATAADASLFVLRWGDSPRLALEYATSVFTAAEAMTLAEAFEATLLDLVARFDQPLSTVRAMSAGQRRLLDELRDGADTGPLPGLWQLLEQRATENPDRVAVHEPGRDLTLTYRQLLHAVARQSTVLAASGVGEGDHVAIGLPRSVEEVVVILASLRIGAAYTALDPTSPTQRLARMLRTVAPRAVVGSLELLARLREVLPAGVAALTAADPGLDEPAGNAPPAAPQWPDRIAYTVFTSGSTGEPKGVRIPQRGVTRLFAGSGPIPLGPDDRVLRLAALAFDISTLEIFGPLAAGAAIEFYPDELPQPSTVAAFFKEHGVTVAVLPSALFRTVAEHRPDAFAGVRHLVTGGDVVPAGPVRALLERHPGLVVSNSYGPSENAVVTTQYDMADPTDVEDPVPIGGPIAGSGVVVLDEAGDLVPPGGIGELCCLGDGLAVDYLDDPARTKAAFGALDGVRLYRSGDIVRWDGGGRIRFLGRRDGQVKIRGYRIELDEVRARLFEHPAVSDVVVAAVGNDSGTRRLLAAVVLKEPLADPVDELKRFAAEGLARYAVPALWAVVDRMPVTSNGKHDLRLLEQLALRADHRPGPATEADQPARPATEADQPARSGN
jgi:amino acid adenylation domain-containing protein